MTAAPAFVILLFVVFGFLIGAGSIFEWRRRRISSGMLIAYLVSASAAFLIALDVWVDPTNRAGHPIIGMGLNFLLVFPAIVILLRRLARSRER